MAAGQNRISRRAILTTAAAAPFAVRAQQSPASPPSNAEEELNAALERQRSNFEEMKKAALPMTVEPASVFKP